MEPLNHTCKIWFPLEMLNNDGVFDISKGALYTVGIA